MSGADDRFSSIAAGGLTRRRPSITAVPDTDSAQAPQGSPKDDPAPSPATPPETSTRPQDKRSKKSDETGGTRRVVFRVPEDLDQLLRSRVASERSSKVHVLLDAVEHVVATTAQLSFAPEESTGTGLFVRPRTAAVATPSVPTEVVIDVRSLVTLDKLAKDYEAPSRTAFFLACLRQHLG